MTYSKADEQKPICERLTGFLQLFQNLKTSQYISLRIWYQSKKLLSLVRAWMLEYFLSPEYEQ